MKKNDVETSRSGIFVIKKGKQSTDHVIALHSERERILVQHTQRESRNTCKQIKENK